MGPRLSCLPSLPSLLPPPHMPTVLVGPFSSAGRAIARGPAQPASGWGREAPGCGSSRKKDTLQLVLDSLGPRLPLLLWRCGN